MARRQKRAFVQRKSWRRLIPKILLVLGYSAIIVFLGAILVMKKELQRFGVFGNESAPVGTPSQPQGARSLSSEGTDRNKTKATSSASTEITPDEKQQLEDILRARSGR